jgi:hypothetical protein
VTIAALPESELLDLAEHGIRQMRSEDTLDRLQGLNLFKMIHNELMDRHRANHNFAAPAPLSGLAETIADAMWDEAGNRIGGPRTAAEAVLAAGYTKDEDDGTQPLSRRRPPMWAVWLIDPSGKYGKKGRTGKAFFEYGETAAAAELTAIARYRVPGTTIDPEHPSLLASVAIKLPERTEVPTEDLG